MILSYSQVSVTANVFCFFGSVGTLQTLIRRGVCCSFCHLLRFSLAIYDCCFDQNFTEIQPVTLKTVVF